MSFKTNIFTTLAFAWLLLGLTSAAALTTRAADAKTYNLQLGLYKDTKCQTPADSAPRKNITFQAFQDCYQCQLDGKSELQFNSFKILNQIPGGPKGPYFHFLSAFDYPSCFSGDYISSATIADNKGACTSAPGGVALKIEITGP